MQLKHVQFYEDVSILYLCVCLVFVLQDKHSQQCGNQDSTKTVSTYAHRDQHLQSGCRMMMFGHYFIDLDVRGGAVVL